MVGGATLFACSSSDDQTAENLAAESIPISTTSGSAVTSTSDTPSTVATTTATLPSSDRSTTTSAPTTIAPTTTVRPQTTPYVVPLADPSVGGWGEGHSGYNATDIFASCGTDIASPVNGELAEVRTVDSWDPDIDNPATRGGKSITIIGNDGVRYYLAHFDEIDSALAVDSAVIAGQRLGTIGLTGRTSGCHVHFGISPPCPDKEWAVRRGAIPPKPYLDAWRSGEQRSPVLEVLQWVNDNPDACLQAMADPFASDA